MLSVITALFLVLGISTTAIASSTDTNVTQQERTEPAQGKPSLYLDCSPCDTDYIREEITYVHYVRDQEQADIHLFITAARTGDGGREYELSYYGRRAFSSLQYEFTHAVDRDMTYSEIRESLTDAIAVGLSPYMMKTPLGKHFSIVFDGLDEELLRTTEIDDPWNHWVFEVYAGSIQLQLESNQRNFNSRWGFYADRVTEDWKIRFRPYFNYHITEIDQTDETIVSYRHRHGIDSYVIMSLTDHWSSGLFGTYLTRNDRNIQNQFEFAPGIEYSLFPYDEATRRSITARYLVGYSHRDYYDLTIFEKTYEDLFNHRIEVQTQYQQPWGTIYAGVTGSHYFHDTSLRRLQTYTRVSIRLAEGLNLSFQTDYDIIRDQLALRAGDLDLEDILLAQQELATDFSFRGLIALSYTFGSDFASVVNTRF